MDSIFDKNRCSNKTSKILSILYFPFGIALVIIRIFITLHALLVACILPKSAITSLILKNIFAVIGIQVVVQEDERKEKNAKVLVSNHVSNLDHMVIDFVIPNITPDMLGFSPMMQWLTGFKDFGTSQGVTVLQNNIRTFVRESKHPVLLHPEKTTTNGTALLKFSTFPFTMGQVQPVAIQVTRWPMAISASTLESNIYEDFFWSLFVPYTIYKIKLLPEEECGETESTEEFTERVRQSIATSLSIPATNYNEGDKKEYIKRLKTEEEKLQAEARARESRRLDNNQMTRGYRDLSESHLEQMFHQVQEVLPNASPESIKQDLKRTQNVDATIANILEGSVNSSSVVQGSSTQPSSPVSKRADQTSSPPQTSPHSDKFGAKTFSNNSSSRMLSFKERKAIMLNTARQRYKEKHGLV